MAKKQRRYWDTATCLGWLAAEQDKVERCQGVLDGAERGDLEIVVSTLVFAEVLWMKGSNRLPKEDRQRIRDFFKREYILPVVLDRRVAELAQDVVWQHNVKPKDAVHIASALYAHCEYFDTFDQSLVSLSGQVGGTPVLTIGLPSRPAQPELFPPTDTA